MNLTKNMGTVDRTLRVTAAATLLLLAYLEIPGGIFGIVFPALAAIFLLTSLAGTCPLYFPFGIRTIKK